MTNRYLKQLTILCLLALSVTAFAQTYPSHTVDFEADGIGADWNWVPAEGPPDFSIVDNPDSSGINTSSQVAQFIAEVSDAQWTLVYTDDDGEFTFDADNATVTIMVHKPRISNVNIKFEGPSGNIELSQANTLTGQWEQLSYDFSAQIGNSYSRIVIIPDNTERTEDVTLYLDNIVVPDGEIVVVEEPTTAPAAPTQPAEDVLSIYSDAYTDLPETNFNPSWGQSTVVTVDAVIADNNTLKYENLNYQGTNLGGAEGVDQDLSGYDFFHMDYWSPNAVILNFSLISRTSGEVAYSLPINNGEWVSVDIPLAHFSGAGLNLTDIFQLKVDVGDGGGTAVWFDNWYLYTAAAGPTEPVAAAPMPIQDPADVMSIYSEAYDNLAESNFNPDWGQATVVTVDADVAGTNTLLYESLNYQGTNLGGAEGVDQDFSSYDFLHVDFWTPNASALNFFLISRTTGEQAYALPITTGEWVSVDIPLSHYTGLGLGLTDVFQFKVDGGDGVETTVWFDNWYFFADEVVTPDEPESPAPTPLWDAETTISLYSDAYDNVPVDTWSADWDVADVEHIAIQGDSTLRYTNLSYAGIEMGSNPIDATEMTHFRMDIWTPDFIADSTVFRVKLVDFGPDGSYAGGDDTEHELTFMAPTLVTGSWVSLDIPLQDFANLAERAHIAQLIISGDPNTVYVDNIMFYTATMPAVPEVAAPTPTQDAESVISLFSNAYTDVTVDTWSAVWDVADVEDIQIEGDDAKLYTNLSYAGIEFTSETIDATGMSHFHMDIWTPDLITDSTAFKIKLVDFGADGAWSGGDDTEHELTFMAPVLVAETWVSLDMSLSDFVNMTAREHLAQLIISGDPNTVYVDNVYLYGDGTSIEDGLAVLPTEHALLPNYPNPFNPSTTIRYQLAAETAVQLSVYDVRGHLVRTLVNDQQAAGRYSLQWDGRNNAGQLIGTGIFLARLEAGSFNETIKMVYMK